MRKKLICTDKRQTHLQRFQASNNYCWEGDKKNPAFGQLQEESEEKSASAQNIKML